MADHLLSQSRLSLIDLRGLGESLDVSLGDAIHEQALYQNQIAAILGAQRDLEAMRLQLEEKLQQINLDLDRAALDLLDAERGEAESAERIRILQHVQEETNAIKHRALEELKMSYQRVPPKVSVHIGPISSSLTPRKGCRADVRNTYSTRSGRRRRRRLPSFDPWTRRS
jgi:hypothetical protein